MLQQIKKHSFALSVKNLSVGMDNFKPLKLLWYPACGDDFRVLHHSCTNNISVQSDFFILSDLNCWENEFNIIINQEGFNIQESEKINFQDLPEDSECYYKTIRFNNGHVNFTKKLLLIWNISNQKLIEIFNQIQYFKLETIFVKRCADFLITDNGYELMQQLNTRYYINSFYSSGLISNSLHEEVVNFSRNQNLLLRAINSYLGVGSNETESLEFVFTFERVE